MLLELTGDAVNHDKENSKFLAKLIKINPHGCSSLLFPLSSQFGRSHGCFPLTPMPI